MIWLRQIAQLSTTISQAHSATAFHCLILVPATSEERMVRACLFDFEPLPALNCGVSCTSFCNLRISLGFGWGSWASIGHVNISHGDRVGGVSNIGGQVDKAERSADFEGLYVVIEPILVRDVLNAESSVRQ
jgi:hypothetical protein